MFYKKLKQLRAEKGLSQGDLAKKADINKMLISKYETKRSTPTMDNLGKIAKALGVCTDYFIYDNVPPDGHSELKDLELFERFKIVEDMDKDDRDTIIKLIDAVIVKSQVEGVVKPRLKKVANK